MTLPRLAIHLYDQHVADVIDAGPGECAVEYTAAALELGSRARLSLSLPVRAEMYASVRGGTRWVRSLLPEGRALSYAIQHFHIPEDDRFALLSVLGRDVAGALDIHDVARVDESRRPGYESLTSGELATLVERAHDVPLGLDADRGVRLSLAGMQDKLLLHRPPRSSRYQLPLHGAPSTVILKPPPSATDVVSTPHLVANEALCLHLAAAVGLPAARCSVEPIGGRDVLVVRRFDREFVGGGIRRIHQEDVLAAMGRDPHLKYQAANERLERATGGFAEVRPIRSDPGPSLVDIADLCRAHLGLGSLLRLLDVVVFNVAIGNADAHARNLSLQLPPDGVPRLAPLYDLIATRFYDGLATDAAQSVGGTFAVDAIGLDDIRREAESWGLPTSAVTRRIDQLVDRLTERLRSAVDATVEHGAAADEVAAIAEFIEGRIARWR